MGKLKKFGKWAGKQVAAYIAIRLIQRKMKKERRKQFWKDD